jgi:hypothetical protein
MASIRVGTYNLEWFFSTQPPLIKGLELAPIHVKASRIAGRIAALKEGPHILALQEVQSEEALAVLTQVLRDAHGLEFSSVCGEFASGRTGQRVAFLYDHTQVRIHKCGSMSFRDKGDIDGVASHVCIPSGMTMEPPLLEKNIYLACEVLGHKMCFVNVHLKAQYDEECQQVRRQEALLLQAMVEALRAEHQGFTMCLLGDFNDFDCSIENATAPRIHSGVLERICSSADASVEPSLHRIRYSSASALLPLPARTSTVYDDLIDHILVDERVCCISASQMLTHPTDNAATPQKHRTSDHYILMAWIDLKQ